MKYRLRSLAIQDIGQRTNQEDSFFPPFIEPCHFELTDRSESYYEGTPHTHDSLFILCDGMGGHDRGEVASRMVCDVMSQYLLSVKNDNKELSDNVIRDAVNVALDALDADCNPLTNRQMGTTMTLLNINDCGATIAHIGDSRVYHFRPATSCSSEKILFRTEDHNLANMLVNSGQMTIQQSRNFSRRHVLTRAMSSCMSVRPDVDIYHTEDILPGDVFFLCSDGIFEELYDEDLCSMMTNPDYSDEQRMQILLNFCNGNKDNHTAWLVRVMQCDNEVYCLQPSDSQQILQPSLKTISHKPSLKWFVAILIASVAAVAVIAALLQN